VKSAFLTVALCLLCPLGAVWSGPLEVTGFASSGFGVYFCHIEGRIGFEQQTLGLGTMNDLINDLGLPGDNRAFRILMSFRPLEHHGLRLYGSLPERYKGSRIAPRDLVTRNGVYPAGTPIVSEMRTAQFGFGYDLDFLVAPRLSGGLHGDLRYLDYRVAMGRANGNFDDSINIDEVMPCIGAHVSTRLPLGPASEGRAGVGGYARITYAITPNYLNYSNISVGISLDFSLGGRLVVEGRAGYEHETVFHDQENISGRVLELKRNGIQGEMEVAF
jgi:hypothetical protein